MATKAEVRNAVLKGLGIYPTSFLFRWCPTWKNPFDLGLLEVSRCSVDGGVVTQNMPNHLRPLHAGHRIKNPNCFSLWELIKVQLRIIR